MTRTREWVTKPRVKTGACGGEAGMKRYGEAKVSAEQRGVNKPAPHLQMTCSDLVTVWLMVLEPHEGPAGSEPATVAAPASKIQTWKKKLNKTKKSETEKKISSSEKGDVWQQEGRKSPCSNIMGSRTKRQAEGAGLPEPALHLPSAADFFFNLLPGLCSPNKLCFTAGGRSFQHHVGKKLSSTGEQSGDPRLEAEYKRSSFCQLLVLMWFPWNERWATRTQDILRGKKEETQKESNAAEVNKMDAAAGSPEGNLSGKASGCGPFKGSIFFSRCGAAHQWAPWAKESLLTADLALCLLPTTKKHSFRHPARRLALLPLAC